MRSALRATAPTAKSNWARAMRIVIPDSLASSRAHVAHGLLDHLRVDAARLERLGQARGRVGGQVLGLVAAQAFADVGLEQGLVARHAPDRRDGLHRIDHVLRDPQRDRSHLPVPGQAALERSEEQTSELQSLMRISYAGFCLKKKK